MEDDRKNGRQHQKWKLTSKMEDDLKMEDELKNGRWPKNGR